MLMREASQPGHSVDPIAKVRQLIRRKTSERDRLLKEIGQCETSLMPLQQQQRTLEALDREIHELFRTALANPKLSKRARQELQGVYESLQADQIITPGRAWFASARANACTCPACSREDDAEFQPEPFDAARGEPPSAEPAPRTQQRPEREASVRDLYRKLALRYHPDRAEDGERAHHEAVMREVNDAYNGGDTERLLELSRELGINVEDLQLGNGLLAELVGQYERIKAEVRALRSSPIGTLVAEMRRARQRGYRSPLEELHDQIATALQQLTGTRDFLRDFTLGKLSLKTFLRGPQLADVEVTESDEILEALEMLEQLDRVARRAERGVRARSRRAGSARTAR